MLRQKFSENKILNLTKYMVYFRMGLNKAYVISHICGHYRILPEVKKLTVLSHSLDEVMVL